MRHRHQRNPATRRRLLCLAIIVALIPIGLICRFAPLGLPAVLVKYGGSFLWAALVYWCIALLFARVRPITLAALAVILSTAVEFFKLVNPPVLDAFRDTFAGKVLLGRYFSWRDIVVYYLAILIALWIDQSALHRPAPSKG